MDGDVAGIVRASGAKRSVGNVFLKIVTTCSFSFFIASH